jgi:GDP-L-fucose synthase
LAKFTGADKVTIWGTGTPKREFLYINDLADVCLFLMKNYEVWEIISVGVGKEFTVWM